MGESKVTCGILFACWLLVMCIAGKSYIFERQFDVDEFLAVQNARILATTPSEAPVELMYLYIIPLSWVVANFDETLSIMYAARIAFFGLFLLNLVLISLVQPYFTSWSGRFLVLIGASLLYPFWKNGTEVRQENLFLFTQIVLYGLMQHLASQGKHHKTSLVLAGIVSVFSVMSVPKSLVYIGPYAIGLIAMNPNLNREAKAPSGRMNTVVWLAGGYLIGLAMAFVLLAMNGEVYSHLEMWEWYYRKAADVRRFSATPLLNVTILQMPHIAGLAATFLLMGMYQIWKSHRLPEWRDRITVGCLFLSVAAVYINPVPFRYNYIHFALFVFFAALGTLSAIKERNFSIQAMILFIVILLGFGSVSAWTEFSPKLLIGQLALYGLTLSLASRRETPVLLVGVAGALCVWMQLFVYRSAIYWILYTVILTIVITSQPDRQIKNDRHRPFVAYMLGALITFLGTILYLAFSGALLQTIRGEGHFMGFSWNDYHVSPAAGVVWIAICGCVIWLLSRQWQLNTIEAKVTGGYLLTEVLAALFFPLPIRITSLHLWSFLGFLVLWPIRRDFSQKGLSNICILVVVYAASIATLFRMWEADVKNRPGNEYQKGYILAVESLTDPAADTVLDGVGMIVSRGVPDSHWYIDSAWLPHYRSGQRTSFREIMLQNPPPPVVITNYRWAWFGPDEQMALEVRYRKLSRFLHVLGGEDKQPDGHFTIHRKGRYRVELIEADAVPDDFQVDGGTIDQGTVLKLDVGKHSYSGAINGGIRYYWVGPRLDKGPVFKEVPPNSSLLKSGW